MMTGRPIDEYFPTSIERYDRRAAQRPSSNDTRRHRLGLIDMRALYLKRGKRPVETYSKFLSLATWLEPPDSQSGKDRPAIPVVESIRHKMEPLRYSHRVFTWISIAGATQPLLLTASTGGYVLTDKDVLGAMDVIPQGRASSARSPERGWTLVRLRAVSACGGPNQVSHRNGRSSSAQIWNLISCRTRGSRCQGR